MPIKNSTFLIDLYDRFSSIVCDDSSLRVTDEGFLLSESNIAWVFLRKLKLVPDRHMRVNHSIFCGHVPEAVWIICLGNILEIKLASSGLCISVGDTVVLQIAIKDAFSHLDWHNLSWSMANFQSNASLANSFVGSSRGEIARLELFQSANLRSKSISLRVNIAVRPRIQLRIIKLLKRSSIDHRSVR